MDYVEWFYKRVAELRLQKGVSAREMSLALGQSESYINKIENKRTLPSMMGFFYICEYLGITPQEFFSVQLSDPSVSKEFLSEFEKLDRSKAEHVLFLLKDLNTK